MSETQWTKGPWYVEEHTDKSGLMIGPKRPDDYSIEVLRGSVDSVLSLRADRRIRGNLHSSESQHANANLIAAAPEMYAALEAFRAWYEDDSTEFARDTAFDMAKKALAKARGEQ